MSSLRRSLFSPKTDEKLEWSKKGLQKLRDEVKRLGSKVRQTGHEPPRILFLGETASGKSSYISSIVSALKGEIVYTGAVGYQEGQEVNNTRRFLENRVFLPDESGEESPLNFILCDSRGIAKKHGQGATERAICKMIQGYFRHDDMISEDDSTYDWDKILSRTPKPPACVVFVQRAQGLGDRDPEVVKKIDAATHLIKQNNLSSCVVLTHIDKVKKNLENSLHQATECKESKERVSTAARLMGVNANRVFVVKNYVDENRTHTRHDILILRAIRAILLDVDQKLADSAQRWSEEEQHSPSSIGAVNPRQPSSHLTDSAFGDDTSHSLASRPRPSGSSMDQQTSVSQVADRSTDQGLRDTQGGVRKSQRRSQAPHKALQLTQPLKVIQSKVDTNSRSANYEQTGQPLNTKRISSSSTLDSARSKNHDFKIKGSPSPSQEEKYSDEDEWALDAGIDVSSLSCGSLQGLIDNLTLYAYPEQYKERANLRGAKALNRKTVFQLNHSDITTSDDAPGLTHQLRKEFLGEEFYTNISRDLQEFAQARTGIVWMSDTLHNDLGVPLDRPPPESMDFQVLFLAPGFPAFLLTVFDAERVLKDRDIRDEEESRRLTRDESTEVEVFALQMGKLLTTAVLNFCSCDFILVPCALSYKEFSAAALTDKLEKEVKATRQYFRGPRVLKETVYQQLKAAVTAVAGASYVPRFLDLESKDSSEDTMVLMDREWREAVFLLIEKLTRVESQDKPDHVTYPEGSWTKMATVVMEVARRLSYVEEVVVATAKEELIECCKKLKRKVAEDTGLSLKLTVVGRDNLRDIQRSSASYVIIIDLPHFMPSMNTVIMYVESSNLSTYV